MWRVQSETRWEPQCVDGPRAPRRAVCSSACRQWSRHKWSLVVIIWELEAIHGHARWSWSWLNKSMTMMMMSVKHNGLYYGCKHKLPEYELVDFMFFHSGSYVWLLCNVVMENNYVCLQPGSTMCLLLCTQDMSVNMIWEIFVSLLYKRRCISIVGVQLWNNVKLDIKMVNSFLVFKRIIYKKMWGL